MFHKVLLLLLPSVAYAQISIRIKIERDNQLSLNSTGLIEDIVSKTEEKTWKIYYELDEVVMLCFGRWPDISYSHSPATGFDPYKTYNKYEVRRISRAYNARVLSVRYESVTLATRELTNNNSNYRGMYNIAITTSVEETLSTTWRTDGKLTIDKNVSYSFIVPTMNSTHNLSFTGLWGKNTNISKTLAVSSDFTVWMKPGEPVVASVIASRVSVAVQVDYEAFLHGMVAAYYIEPYQGQHYDFRDIYDCLQKARKRMSVFSDVVIKIVFYADFTVAVSKNWAYEPVHYHFKD